MLDEMTRCGKVKHSWSEKNQETKQHKQQKKPIVP